MTTAACCPDSGINFESSVSAIYRINSQAIKQKSLQNREILWLLNHEKVAYKTWVVHCGLLPFILAGGKIQNELSAVPLQSQGTCRLYLWSLRAHLSKIFCIAPCCLAFLLLTVLLELCKILMRWEGFCPQMTLYSIACWTESLGYSTVPIHVFCFYRSGSGDSVWMTTRIGYVSSN